MCLPVLLSASLSTTNLYQSFIHFPTHSVRSYLTHFPQLSHLSTLYHSQSIPLHFFFFFFASLLTGSAYSVFFLYICLSIPQTTSLPCLSAFLPPPSHVQCQDLCVLSRSQSLCASLLNHFRVGQRCTRLYFGFKSFRSCCPPAFPSACRTY